MADSNSYGDSRVENSYNNDPLYLQPSDHPSIPITNSKFTGSNFQKWSRSVKIGFQTKEMLGFITGKCSKLAENASTYNQWIKIDSMIRVERQRQITGGLHIPKDLAGCVTKPEISETDLDSQALLAENPSRFKKDPKGGKPKRFCDNCQRSGHTEDQCFQIIGYPDWYQGPKDGKSNSNGPRVAANVNKIAIDSDTPLDFYELPSTSTTSQFDSNFLQALAQAVAKINKEKHPMNKAFGHFAGTQFAGGPSSQAKAKAKKP